MEDKKYYLPKLISFFFVFFLIFSFNISAVFAQSAYGSGTYGGDEYGLGSETTTPVPRIQSSGGGGGGKNTKTNITATSTPSAKSLSSLSLPLFKKSLSLKSTGADVKNLQKFLNAQGFIVSKIGPGSPGLETSYFGPATKSALIKFQEAYASVILTPLGLKNGTGYFGPATINFINKLK